MGIGLYNPIIIKTLLLYSPHPLLLRFTPHFLWRIIKKHLYRTRKNQLNPQTLASFVAMENLPILDNPIPPYCFRQEEVQQLLSVENKSLTAINYYLWRNVSEEATTTQLQYRFLYALELIFDSDTSLLISSGDDSEAIGVIKPATMLETASRLKQLHGQPIIQRLPRDGQSIWIGLVGKKLNSIQLARHESGLYQNDALLFHFDTTSILVELTDTGEGLTLKVV